MAEFLLEIGVEEIPARMVDGAREELSRRVGDLLARERLSEAPEAEAFSTPRRLAVRVRGVAPHQPDVQEQLTGPSLKVAYKDGSPTAAAEAFARKAGIPLASLEKISTPKGEYVAATVQRKGRPAWEILTESLPREIATLYWPKSMYWRGKSRERFVRPVRWLVSMLDREVVPVEFGGITAGRTSQGHRILSPGAVEIDRPRNYESALAASSVTVSSPERERHIRQALDAATRSIPGARWREDRALLETVVNLTEFPSVILGSFDPEFLSLPAEVLVTVMRDHQKYFALEDAAGKLCPHFLAVLNTSGDPDGLICHANERVLRARFNDARFFWNTDQKISLRQRVNLLQAVTFQTDLGSYFDKTLRVQRLGSLVSEVLRQAGLALRPGVVFKAAYLAKADLTTELVKEFTELQGIVGGLYAKVQQLDPALSKATAEAIGDAIYHHYQPESMDDGVPPTLEGAVLAIADKADTITGMFALGLEPSGSKDPFALRRAANGIIRIVAEHALPLTLGKLFSDARAEYAGSEAESRFDQTLDCRAAITVFMRERLEFYLRDVRGFRYDVVNAVLAAGADDVVDALARADAVKNVRGLPDFESIAAAFKRINNILRQASEKGVAIAPGFEELPDIPHEEKVLRAKAELLRPRFEKAYVDKDYGDALLQLSTLRPSIDLFFDKVMVMVDDERVRANRLALLATLLQQFSTIADFSEMVTETKSS